MYQLDWGVFDSITKKLIEKGNTGDPRLMRISLLQFFKTFQIYLANAFFEPKYLANAGNALARV